MLRSLAQRPDRERRLARSQQGHAVEVVELRVVGALLEKRSERRKSRRELTGLLQAADLVEPSLRAEAAAHGERECDPEGKTTDFPRELLTRTATGSDNQALS
jgi:hypothetical protein